MAAPLKVGAVVARMHALRPGVDDVMREAGKLLSSLTGAAAVVVTPRPDEERFLQYVYW